MPPCRGGGEGRAWNEGAGLKAATLCTSGERRPSLCSAPASPRQSQVHLARPAPMPRRPGRTRRCREGLEGAHRRNPGVATRDAPQLAHRQAARVGGGGGGCQVGHCRRVGVCARGSAQHKGAAPRVGQPQAGAGAVFIGDPGVEGVGVKRGAVHRNACTQGGRGGLVRVVGGTAGARRCCEQAAERADACWRWRASAEHLAHCAMQAWAPSQRRRQGPCTRPSPSPEGSATWTAARILASVSGAMVTEGATSQMASARERVSATNLHGSPFLQQGVGREPEAQVEEPPGGSAAWLPQKRQLGAAASVLLRPGAHSGRPAYPYMRFTSRPAGAAERKARTSSPEFGVVNSHSCCATVKEAKPPAACRQRQEREDLCACPRRQPGLARRRWTAPSSRGPSRAWQHRRTRDQQQHAGAQAAVPARARGPAPRRPHLPQTATAGTCTCRRLGSR